jgi:hypothetical protein
MLGCFRREAVQTTSKNFSSSLKDNPAIWMFFTAKTFEKEEAISCKLKAIVLKSELSLLFSV